MPDLERWWPRLDPLSRALLIFGAVSVPWFVLAVQKQEPWRAAYGVVILLVGAVLGLVLRKRGR